MTEALSPSDLDALTTLAITMARDAGQLAIDQRLEAVGQINTKSSTADIVTAADEAAETLITERLVQSRPNDSIVGEEGASVKGDSGVTWFIDPIDGTTNFFYGLPGWVVSIAASDAQGLAVGAVFDPVANVMYSAFRNGGASRNGLPISVRTSTVGLATALVATGFSYQGSQRKRQAEILVDLIPQVRDIRRLGAAAKDLCLVAEGAYDAYYEAGLNVWDLAAGWVIAIEAGARIEYLTPETEDRRLLLAAAPGVFDPLRSALEATGAPTNP